ncbi:terminase [Bradyrhizobium genosp. SA-3]|uniref:terminase n=1 Tax=Bradyrhizobium genosp. SA-3 TaxID=508868 RepID=UPI00102A7BE2|nr:terminase [Bradyrhizobium genosp. SA-3]RZN09648.1 terminase [Bradyrhizobium genosp. SA-3]
MANIVYNAPPTLARFMSSAAFGRLVAGPVGSGKTTACIVELFRRAAEQAPAPDGLRYTRFAIVRQTLKQLKDTVLKDILDWLKAAATYKVSDNTVYVSIGDIRSEWLLIPLDDPEDQRRLLSMQLTGAWMSECIEMDYAIVAPLSGRCGRYPKEGATWSGIIADTNMPTEGTDWHTHMSDPPPDWQVFIQPGGLDPDAENLPWLNQSPDTKKLAETDPLRIARGREYYLRNARNPNPDWVRRYVHAQYGNDPSGTAVFRESFNRAFHVVEDLMPVAHKPLIIGQDFGRDPCSVICQLDHQGRLLVLQEVIAEDIGLELHVEKALRPAVIHERYLGHAIAMVGDPAGISKSSIYEETTFDVLKRLGFNAFPAPTNDIDPRLRAVEAFLLAQRNGGPAMLIDRDRCPTIVRALAGGYRYAKTRNGTRKPLPDKNEYSHIIDALQYACLAAHGGMSGYFARMMAHRPRSTRGKMPTGAWT